MSAGEGTEVADRESKRSWAWAWVYAVGAMVMQEKLGLGLGLCSRGYGYAREAGPGLRVMPWGVWLCKRSWAWA